MLQYHRSRFFFTSLHNTPKFKEDPDDFVEFNDNVDLLPYCGIEHKIRSFMPTVHDSMTVLRDNSLAFDLLCPLLCIYHNDDTATSESNSIQGHSHKQTATEEGLPMASDDTSVEERGWHRRHKT